MKVGLVFIMHHVSNRSLFPSSPDLVSLLSGEEDRWRTMNPSLLRRAIKAWTNKRPAGPRPRDERLTTQRSGAGSAQFRNVIVDSCRPHKPLHLSIQLEIDSVSDFIFVYLLSWHSLKASYNSSWTIMKLCAAFTCHLCCVKLPVHQIHTLLR